MLSIAAGLPFSRFLISVGGFLLLIHLVLSKKLFKPKMYLNNTLVQAFLLLVLVHIIGLFWTEDLAFAAKDLRIKLPLLLYPIALAVNAKLLRANIAWVLLVFFLSLLGCSVFIFIHKMGWGWRSIDDFRALSPKVSHIRLGLLYGFGVVALFELLRKAWTNSNLKSIVIYISLCVIFLYSLNALQAVVTFGALAITVICLLTVALYKRTGKVLKTVSPFVLLVLFCGILIGNHFLSKEAISLQKERTERTLSGNTYDFIERSKTVENGHYVWHYIARDELDKALFLKTGKTLSDTIASGEMLYGVLMRYMSSKGLKKDKEGFEALSTKDLENIFAGVCNYKIPERIAIVNRYHKLMREIDLYLSDERAAGSTLLQRFVYWKTAITIIKANPFLGVGTGDTKNAFEHEYENNESDLPKQYWFRAHNQYLSFFVAFGILGGLYCLFFMGKIVAYWLKNVPYLAWKSGVLSIVFLSFMSEDTLETQVGVSLATLALCTALFLNRKPTDESISLETNT